MYILSVIPLTKIPFPSPQTLDYFSKDAVSSGGIVEVPIGSRKLLAVVASCAPVSKLRQQIKKSTFKLKPIEKITSKQGIVSKPYLTLAIWTSNYFYSPLGLVMKTLLPQAFSRPTKKFIESLRLIPPANRDTDVHMNASKPILYWAHHNKYAKFDFYTKEIQKTFLRKKSVLFLVPEIYKVQYFQKKLPILKNFTAVHGRLSARQQYEVWQKAYRGEEPCIVGTRAALAIQLPKLGLIIVDEEESPFYKSSDQQPYINAKDVALKLGRLSGAQVLLGTNLPSIESFWRVERGEYELSEAKVREQESGNKIIDMKEELKAGNYSIFSRELQAQIQETLRTYGQLLLFINRRGLSTGLLCRDCGHIVRCPNCDVPMVYHQTSYGLRVTDYGLICHHCGEKQKPPTVCPECRSYRIKFIGAGTQRVQQELQKFCGANNIKQCRAAVLDTDIAPTWEDQKKVFAAFRRKKCDVLIGTQLMLKKGLLPKIPLAGVVTLDPLFSIPDFRTAEYAFRILHRLRAVSGLILIQTYMAENPLAQHVFSSSWNEFASRELANRKELFFPPFSQLIRVTYRHKDASSAEQQARLLKNKLGVQWDSIRPQIPNTKYRVLPPRPSEAPQSEGGLRPSETPTASQSVGEKEDEIRILGPSPTFIPRVKGRYVWQVMIKSKGEDLALRNKLLRVIPNDWKIDVDPVEMA